MPKRKHPSGHTKRQQKRKAEKLIQSQKGALDKFIIKETQAFVENLENVDSLSRHDENDSENVDTLGEDENDNENMDNLSHDESDNENMENLGHVGELGEEEQLCQFFSLNIYDPRTWDGLDSKSRDELLANGPIRDLSIEKGPLDKFYRHFSSKSYTRYAQNGDKYDREWLVYSKDLDKVFCFCCKLFNKSQRINPLTNEGYGDWRHLSKRLKEHERSGEHMTNMTTWIDFKMRMEKNETIDKHVQKLLNKEKEHWKSVLIRIISAVKYLAKYTLAFRGTNERIHENSNGNFIGLIEMIAQWDSIMKEHLRRIDEKEIYRHYLSPKIQNELILMISNEIKSAIIQKIEKAKYFSVILDCTPDVSHKEQMTLILRCVDISTSPIKIEEFFVEYLKVDDTSGQALFKELENVLKNLDLKIDNVRGQGYDNGSNMSGKYQGVHARLLDINPRALYTPCACHCLNLTLCDIADSCTKAKNFFGVVQSIYNMFSHSTKRWKILTDNVKRFTLKPLSGTRWVSRVESVKALRFQTLEVRDALLQLVEQDNDSTISVQADHLARHGLGNFEFLLAMVIWYDILYAVNCVSEKLQEKDMLIDVAIELIKGLIDFFEQYREFGLSHAMHVAKKISVELEVDPIFVEKRQLRRKRHFDENVNESTQSTHESAEESFRIHYFLYIVDQAIGSLKRRFEQYKIFEDIFGFLFTLTNLKSLDENSLESCCDHLEEFLKYGESYDLDGKDLFGELKIIREILPKEAKRAIDILSSLQRLNCFPNAITAYRILLTLPVTVASAERSFSKLKLLKSYLRSTMSQERLNGLTLMSIESDLLDGLDCTRLIEDFAAKNARRTVFR